MTRHNRFTRFFLSPDTDTATLGGGIADVIPAAGTGPSVTEINLDVAPAIENSPAVKALVDRTRKPEDLGMHSAEEDSELMGLTKPRARGADGKFLPKDEAGAPAAQPAKPQAAKPVAKAPAPAKPAAVKPAPAAVPPVVPAKVKIGDLEKTPTEWDAHFKELAAKAKAAEQPAAPKAPEKPVEPAKTPEEQAAAYKEQEAQFIAKAHEGYVLSEADLDTILMGGPQGSKKLAEVLATAEMKSRQFAADNMQKMYDDIREELAGLDPIRQSHSQVQELIAETAFLGANKDIADHPQGLEIFRRLSNQMKEGYEDTRAKVAAGTATKSEQGWLLQYEDLTPEVLRDTIAGHTRTEMAKVPVAAPVAAPAVPVVPPKPAAPKIVERPLGGDRPGAIGTPRTESHEASLARQVNALHGH